MHCRLGRAREGSFKDFYIAVRSIRGHDCSCFSKAPPWTRGTHYYCGAVRARAVRVFPVGWVPAPVTQQFDQCRLNLRKWAGHVKHEIVLVVSPDLMLTKRRARTCSITANSLYPKRSIDGIYLQNCQFSACSRPIPVS